MYIDSSIALALQYQYEVLVCNHCAQRGDQKVGEVHVKVYMGYPVALLRNAYTQGVWSSSAQLTRVPLRA